MRCAANAAPQGAKVGVGEHLLQVGRSGVQARQEHRGGGHRCYGRANGHEGASSGDGSQHCDGVWCLRVWTGPAVWRVRVDDGGTEKQK